MEFIFIGPSPLEEHCAQVGCDNYREQARLECALFIKQLRRQLGDEPPGATLKTRWFPHDFGSYVEVIVEYDETDTEAEDYAYKVEGNTPGTWDDEALKVLKELTK